MEVIKNDMQYNAILAGNGPRLVQLPILAMPTLGVATFRVVAPHYPKLRKEPVMLP